ncbi:ATP-binding cassette domain-containing protein, partial [Christensenella sp.]
MGIEIRNVDITIDDTPILYNISLTFDSGMVGVLGPNGAGKTTLLRVVSG